MRSRGVNLISLSRRHAHQRRGHVRRWTVALTIYAVLLLCASVAMHVRARDYGAAAALLAQHEKRLTTLDAEVAQQLRSIAEAQAAMQAAEALANQPDWSSLLTILSGSVGEDVVLRQIELAPQSAADAQSLALSLRGFGRTQASVSQFVLRLQSVGVFEQVKLLRTSREPVLDTSAVTFDISCQLSDAPAALATGAGEAKP